MEFQAVSGVVLWCFEKLPSVSELLVQDLDFNQGCTCVQGFLGSGCSARLQSSLGQREAQVNIIRFGSTESTT